MNINPINQLHGINIPTVIPNKSITITWTYSHNNNKNTGIVESNVYIAPSVFNKIKNILSNNSQNNEQLIADQIKFYLIKGDSIFVLSSRQVSNMHTINNMLHDINSQYTIIPNYWSDDTLIYILNVIDDNKINYPEYTSWPEVFTLAEYLDIPELETYSAKQLANNISEINKLPINIQWTPYTYVPYLFAIPEHFRNNQTFMKDWRKNHTYNAKPIQFYQEIAAILPKLVDGNPDIPYNLTDNHSHSLFGIYDNNSKLTGFYLVDNKTGILLAEAPINKNNILNGYYVNWWPNGNLRRVIYYDNGKRHGKYMTYFHTGLPAIEGEYLNDKPIGTWKTYKPDGKTVISSHKYI